jgi:hypothetical protein
VLALTCFSKPLLSERYVPSLSDRRVFRYEQQQFAKEIEELPIKQGSSDFLFMTAIGFLHGVILMLGSVTTQRWSLQA